MTESVPAASPRRDELLERAYAYVIENGIAGMSLRPLATAIGTSPRVLLFLFGSKDELVRALLARARVQETELIREIQVADGGELGELGLRIWRWLSADRHRGLLTLWVESYARALVEPHGPWAGFATDTVSDWLELLARAQPPAERRTARGRARCTLVLAVLRGALLDLLASGEVERTTLAVRDALTGL